MKTKADKYFFTIVVINSILCVLTLIGMIILAFINKTQANDLQINVYETCETVFKMSAGAFIGLLGGRASSD